MSDLPDGASVQSGQQEEHSRVTAGQRRTNILWEVTQSMIALAATGAAMYASVVITLRSDMDKTAFIFLTNVLFVVLGFYFGRTNHTRSGGPGQHWSER